MKIAILTLPPRENYGGILQCYALQTTLERMGHNVTIIDEPYKVKHVPATQMFLRICKRIIYKYILRKNCHIFIEKEMERLRLTIRQNMERFMSQYLHRKVYNSVYDIKEEEYDTIIVGSDQIWRYKYYNPISNAFLYFTRNWNINRIAYAASFGIDYWDYDDIETKKCREMVKLFKAISVRENSGINLCKKYLNVDAKWVVDPTMLLSKSDYNYLIEAIDTDPCKGNLFCYILDQSDDKKKLIKRVAEEKNLKPFEMTENDGDVKNNVEGLIKKPIEYWLKAFRDSEFIITDSFHACVFSIIFGKPFVVVGNKDRGMARFDSLFKRFNLKDNLLYTSSDYISGKDYSLPVTINEILKKSTIEGLSFLKDNLAN